MAKTKKLNSMRLLETRAIAYEIHTYDSQIRDAEAVAQAVGLPAGEVFKTLVVERLASKKPVLVMLPCHCSVNMKRLAKALGEKKVALAPQAAAERLTGLKVGGISALALVRKQWDVYLDARFGAQIVISAGQRGTQLRLETSALIDLLSCQIVDVADPKAS